MTTLASSQMLAGVALSTVVRGVYLAPVGPGEDRSQRPTPTDAVCPRDTYGDEGKAAGFLHGRQAALLFRSRPHNFDVDQRRRLRSCCWNYTPRLCDGRTRRTSISDLGHHLWWPTFADMPNGRRERQRPDRSWLLCDASHIPNADHNVT
jgi:hypothetical protein